MNDQSAGKTRAVDLNYHNISQKNPTRLCNMHFQKKNENYVINYLSQIKNA